MAVAVVVVVAVDLGPFSLPISLMMMFSWRKVVLWSLVEESRSNLVVMPTMSSYVSTLSYNFLVVCIHSNAGTKEVKRSRVSVS